jgi:hypothetical protein
MSTNSNDIIYRKDGETITAYEERIGIKKLIDKHLSRRRNSRGKEGKKWLALSPHWIESNTEDVKHKYQIKYWVNYGDDETFGWFTVEAIMKWLSDDNLKLSSLGGTVEKYQYKK